MKKQFSVFLSILVFASTLAAQKQHVQPVDPTEANLRRTIEYLASNKLEGRRTGEPGATLAAGYIANQFAKIRLRPGAGGKNGKASFLQPFPYVTGVEMAKGNTFTIMTTSQNGTRYTARDKFPVRPVGFSPNATVTNAPVVFAGYGITSADAKFDDYSDIDVKGDVVLVFDGNPDNDNPHSPFARFDVRTKALIAKEHGAVGMLIITRESNVLEDRLWKLGYDQSLGEAAVPTLIIPRAAAFEILGYDDASLRTAEAVAAAKKDGTKTAIVIQDRKPAVSFKIDLVKKSVSAYNVIGVLPGNDATLKNEAIVIGAHYDHLGHGGAGSLAANSTEIHHGADDNASGTAAIIELARQFAREKKNKRTLIFIAFSGEEEGLFGSNFYVNNPIFPLDKTGAMINLDMVGRLNENKLTIGGMGTASEWKQLIQNRNDFDLPDFSSEPAWPTWEFHFKLSLNEDGFGPSDHSSFYGKKIPVLFLFTGTHNDYHKPTDTADKINYHGEMAVAAFVFAVIRDIDQNPTRPTYTVAKTTMQGGRSGFNISLGTIPNYADSNDGLLLDGVRDGSPAAKAGVKAGDKVVKLAGHDIRNVMDYTYVLGEMKAGVEYEIVVLRGGERLTLKIVPVKR